MRYYFAVLPLLGLLSAPLLAQDFEFKISQSQSQADLISSFAVDLPGTLIGNHDPVDNPDGTRTLPGLIGGSGNQPVDADFGFLGDTTLAGKPTGTFALDVHTESMTLLVDGFELDLMGGAEGVSELFLHLEFETFRTFDPDSLYFGGIPVDMPLGSQVIRDAILTQIAPSEAGTLVGGDGTYTFTALVPVELSFTLVVGEQETPVGPVPLILPFSGSLEAEGALATATFGFDLDESQVIDDPLPDFELTDVPLDLPTILPPGNTANLLLNAIIASLTLDVMVDVDLVAEGEAPCGFESYCAGEPNSTGQGAELVVTGSVAIGDDDLVFLGVSLPPMQFAYLMMARERDQIPFLGGGQGTLCLSQPVLRFTPHVVPTGRRGAIELAVDFENLPPGVSIVACDVWNFQLWYRDKNPGGTTSTSNAIGVVFCQ